MLTETQLNPRIITVDPMKRSLTNALRAQPNQCIINVNPMISLQSTAQSIHHQRRPDDTLIFPLMQQIWKLSPSQWYSTHISSITTNFWAIIFPDSALYIDPNREPLRTRPVAAYAEIESEIQNFDEFVMTRSLSEHLANRSLIQLDGF